MLVTPFVALLGLSVMILRVLRQLNVLTGQATYIIYPHLKICVLQSISKCILEFENPFVEKRRFDCIMTESMSLLKE